MFIKEGSIMNQYIVNGGKKLYGEVEIDGCKNALLPILAASICTNKKIILNNCPNILDREVAINILKNIGAKIEIFKKQIIIETKNINKYTLPSNMVCLMRSSIIFMGAILSRFGKASASFPGGCNLGARPIDLHLNGFRSLGIDIKEENGDILCYADNIVGNKIKLNFPSVGATQNIILASIFAKGETIIENAAKEPEIIDFCNFLRLLGAKIKGDGSYIIIIKGIDKKALEEDGTIEYTIMPDRIIAGTYMIAAAITKGNVRLNNIEPLHISSVISNISRIGANISIGSDWLEINMKERPRAIKYIKTMPYPGFPTDIQPQMMALLSVAKGKSVIFESIFESRNKHVLELKKLGADIMQEGQRFIINGKNNLNPFEVFSRDLRGGAALIIASLSIDGKSVIKDNNHIRRGYESIEFDLKKLGADINLI